VVVVLAALPLVLVAMYFVTPQSWSKQYFLLAAVLVFPLLTWIGLLVRAVSRKNSGVERSR
jgi:hypothetical protein